MRLIDADRLKCLVANYDHIIFRIVSQRIDEQPIAYDVNKVIEQLKNEKFNEQETILSDIHQGYNAGLSRVIQIVEKGGLE